MSQEKLSSTSIASSTQTGRTQSPSPTNLRHRPPLRSSTVASGGSGLSRRRSSIFSETLSETHRSFRNSTDDLLLPRVKTPDAAEDQLESSHWHSLPLGLALLPAVGGLLFKDGSAVITDITLLGLAAIFLNWALRLPWEWYRAAQTTAPLETQLPVIDESDDELDGAEQDVILDAGSSTPRVNAEDYSHVRDNNESLAAQQELRIHQLLALSACFGFPLLGAWLLHAIRSQLSRPSEGLVSNYNLTIFLLVAELRPLSHLMKLIQRRTLYLQRKVSSSMLEEREGAPAQDVIDMGKRLEELEAHIADAVAASSAAKSSATPPPDVIVSKAASQASNELRKAFQPELDALNRAMRRYEKRMTISAIQVESRLQDMETRLKDVVVLAAAAQRNAESQPRNYIAVLTNWVCGVVVLPLQLAYNILAIPGKVSQVLLDWVKSFVFIRSQKGGAPKDGKATQRAPPPRPRTQPKKPKGAA